MNMYTCLYADADGESHFRDVEIEFRETDFAPPALPLNASAFGPAMQYGFLTAPPGWYGDWHPTPRRQFLFYLAGQTEIRVSDGEVRSFGPGDILLLEDTTGKGHVSRVVGSEEALSAVVQLPG
jgi:hypothetical protein